MSKADVFKGLTPAEIKAAQDELGDEVVFRHAQSDYEDRLEKKEE